MYQRIRIFWRNKKSRLVMELLILFLIFILLQSWLQRHMVDGTAPPIQATLLSGKLFSLKQLRGKAALVHFWATWCGICKLEEETIAALSKTHQVITIAMQSGNANDISAYMESHGLTFNVIVDDEAVIAEKYGVSGVPASFILSPQGDIVFKQRGFTTAWGLRLRLWLASFSLTQ